MQQMKVEFENVFNALKASETRRPKIPKTEDKEQAKIFLAKIQKKRSFRN